jgi:hypothetical protein
MVEANSGHSKASNRMAAALDAITASIPIRAFGVSQRVTGDA